MGGAGHSPKFNMFTLSNCTLISTKLQLDSSGALNYFSIGTKWFLLDQCCPGECWSHGQWPLSGNCHDPQGTCRSPCCRVLRAFGEEQCCGRGRAGSVRCSGLAAVPGTTNGWERSSPAPLLATNKPPLLYVKCRSQPAAGMGLLQFSHVSTISRRRWVSEPSHHLFCVLAEQHLGWSDLQEWSQKHQFTQRGRK